MRSRDEVVKLANSWVGLNEKDGSYKKIIDIYNSYGKLPRNLKMQYNWSWCACTWSAIAIKLGYTDIMPIEISCGNLITLAKKIGIWVENDGYLPSPGDAILYDWNDNGKYDCTGWPDHIGVIESVNKESGYFTVIEGNYSNSVKKRTVSINGRYIRGFIVPKYDNNIVDLPGVNGLTISEIAKEVIAGLWGKYPRRKEALESYGYNYDAVQEEVNRILNGNAVETSTPEQDPEQPTNKSVKATCYAKNKNSALSGTYLVTASPFLYGRNDAGTNKKAICKIPKGTKVQCYGYYTNANGAKWLLISFAMDGVRYTVFAHSKYLDLCLSKVG